MWGGGENVIIIWLIASVSIRICFRNIQFIDIWQYIKQKFHLFTCFNHTFFFYQIFNHTYFHVLTIVFLRCQRRKKKKEKRKHTIKNYRFTRKKYFFANLRWNYKRIVRQKISLANPFTNLQKIDLEIYKGSARYFGDLQKLYVILGSSKFFPTFTRDLRRICMSYLIHPKLNKLKHVLNMGI